MIDQISCHRRDSSKSCVCVAEISPAYLKQKTILLVYVRLNKISHIPYIINKISNIGIKDILHNISDT